MKGELVLIAHDIRSAHNVGALLRTANGAGVTRVYLSGYTPRPAKKNALVRTRAEKEIEKTALGAERDLCIRGAARLGPLLRVLRREGYEIISLEQASGSRDYRRYQPKGKVVLLVGTETTGLPSRILGMSDVIIEIPMHGSKNSLNVVVAAGIALYSIRSTIEVS